MQISTTAIQREMIRQEIGTQKELAAKAGVNPNTVCGLFRGTVPKLSTIQKLAAALKCDPLELLEGD